MGSGVDKRSLERSSYEVLMGEASVAEVVVAVEHSSYSLLPANPT